MRQVLAQLFRVNKIGGEFVGPFHDALPDTIHEGIVLIALAVAVAKSLLTSQTLLTKVRHTSDVSDDSDDDDDGGSDGEEVEHSDSDGTEFSDSDSDTQYSSDGSEGGSDNGLCYVHWDDTMLEPKGEEEEE